MQAITLPIWLLGVLIPITDIVCAAGASYITYRILAWKASQLSKKMHPDAKNGLNINMSYKIDNNEVLGLHLSGCDLGDLLDNAGRWLGDFTKRKDEVIKDNIAKENKVIS